MLNPIQRSHLLRIARESIEAVLRGSRPQLDPAALDEDLLRPSGCFVTLKTGHGELRGCIGSIIPTSPLYQAVSTTAISSALRDPRFLPLRPEELPGVAIEISVMGPIEPVADVESIVVGQHGLIVTVGRRAGLLLPQVASEYGWDRHTFLRQTCLKAGVQPDSWRSPECRLEYFSAEVFGETNH
jgi:AmmeMemoRadiSam system protein A